MTRTPRGVRRALGGIASAAMCWACGGTPAPRRVAAVPIAHADALRGMAVIGDTALLTLARNDGPEVLAIDVADPRHPRLAWSFEMDADVNAIATPSQGSITMLATSRDDAELVLFDVAARRIVGTFDVPGTSDGVFTAYVGLSSDRGWIGTTDNPEGTEAYALDLHDPAHPLVTGRNEASAPLADPRPPDPRAHGYDAGGTVVARARGSADPGLTFLAVQSPDAGFQVVPGLDDALTVRDVDGDGVRLVACLGDSNTLTLMTRNPGSWCHHLRQTVWSPKTVFVEWAWLGGTMTPAESPILAGQLDQLRAWHADLAIVAFGTNDVTRFQPEEVLTAAQALTGALERDGMEYLIATPPPRTDKMILGQRVDTLAELIRGAYPANRILDFRAGLTPADLAADGVHLNLQGVLAQGRMTRALLVAP